MAVVWNNASKSGGGKIFITRPSTTKIFKWKLTYDITQLTAELKTTMYGKNLSITEKQMDRYTHNFENCWNCCPKPARL